MSVLFSIFVRVVGRVFVFMSYCWINSFVNGFLILVFFGILLFNRGLRCCGCCGFFLVIEFNVVCFDINEKKKKRKMNGYRSSCKVFDLLLRNMIICRNKRFRVVNLYVLNFNFVKWWRWELLNRYYIVYYLCGLFLMCYVVCYCLVWKID